MTEIVRVAGAQIDIKLADKAYVEPKGIEDALYIAFMYNFGEPFKKLKENIIWDKTDIKKGKTEAQTEVCYHKFTFRFGDELQTRPEEWLLFVRVAAGFIDNFVFNITLEFKRII